MYPTAYVAGIKKGGVCMSTNKSLLSFNIEGGPSADRLIDSFKYTYSQDVKVPVTFTVTRIKNENEHTYDIAEITDVRIVTIAHESGSGQSFNLTGYCKLPSSTSLRMKFMAYYNAKTRKGILTIPG